MTTAPVMSITDEMVAELEALAAASIADIGAYWYRADENGCIPVMCGADRDFIELVTPGKVLALLAERAELKRDAERLGWVFGEAPDLRRWRQRIDAAMKAAQ